MGDCHMPRALKPLLKDIRACRICTETPDKIALPHEPRPVLQADRGAKLAIFGQAPGNLVHQTGIPFNDPSGDPAARLARAYARTVLRWKGNSRSFPWGFVSPAMMPKAATCRPGRSAHAPGAMKF